MHIFGERLKKLRQGKRLTQDEFAAILSQLGCNSITKYSISQYENNKGFPHINTLIIICDYFGVSIDYIVRGSQYPSCEYFLLDKKGKKLADEYILKLLDNS